MSSPPRAQAGEVAFVVRPFEGRLHGDASSDASSDAAEELPECKVKRNYSCTKCTFYTQNPRAFLVHCRDVHFERFKIYDCAHCLYASRHHQKLLRHLKMVHGTQDQSAASVTIEPELPPQVQDFNESQEMEDLLEEVEECDDVDMETEDNNVDPYYRSGDIEFDGITVDDINQPKAKSDFFSCDKCSYVTHIKARYKKHVKYHSIPRIKCSICEFRTPYKWNLDRHMKNHGGTGSFSCYMCNFTADIKQSLTAHEMNHHSRPVGQSVPNRRRNRVGASEASRSAPITLVSKEEEGSGDGDSRSSHSASVSVASRRDSEGPRPGRSTGSAVTSRSCHRCYHER